MYGMGQGRARPAAKFIKTVLIPLVVWAATAAPSFGGPGQEGYRLAKFQPDTLSSATRSLINRTPVLTPDYERPAIDSAIEQIYLSVSRGQLSKALGISNRLIEQYPNFKVAYLIRGDLLLLKAGRPLRTIGDISDPPVDKARELIDLREEAIVRLRSYRDRPSADVVPRELVQLRGDQRYAILVDTKRARLFLYENTLPAPRLVTDFYITQGKMGADKEKEGDQKTPIGVYTITDLLPKQKLTDFYGAMALPLNYPNEWDKRQGRTGHGIWVHGIPSNTVSQPPKASDGCVVLGNADIERLRGFVKVGTTPVVISDSLDFIPVEVWQGERQAMLRVLDTWRRDYESAEYSKLFEHYSTQGYVDGLNITQWRNKYFSSYASKKGPKLNISNVAIMRYPARDDMMVISFDQDLKINGEAQSTRRKQYWVKEGTNWRIVHDVTLG